MSLTKIKQKINELLAYNYIEISHPDYMKKFDEKMASQETIMDELKVLAKANNTILGRTIQFPMADSYALYLITKVNKKSVVLSWVEYCDAWQDDRLGDKGTIDYQYAFDKVKGVDRMAELFSKNN